MTWNSSLEACLQGRYSKAGDHFLPLLSLRDRHRVQARNNMANARKGCVGKVCHNHEFVLEFWPIGLFAAIGSLCIQGACNRARLDHPRSNFLRCRLLEWAVGALRVVRNKGIARQEITLSCAGAFGWDAERLQQLLAVMGCRVQIFCSLLRCPTRPWSQRVATACGLRRSCVISPNRC